MPARTSQGTWAPSSHRRRGRAPRPVHLLQRVRSAPRHPWPDLGSRGPPTRPRPRPAARPPRARRAASVEAESKAAWNVQRNAGQVVRQGGAGAAVDVVLPVQEPDETPSAPSSAYGLRQGHQSFVRARLEHQRVAGPEHHSDGQVRLRRTAEIADGSGARPPTSGSATSSSRSASPAVRSAASRAWSTTTSSSGVRSQAAGHNGHRDTRRGDDDGARAGVARSRGNRRR